MMLTNMLYFRTTHWMLVPTLTLLWYAMAENHTVASLTPTTSTVQNITPNSSETTTKSTDTKPAAKASSITLADAKSIDSIPTFDFSKTNGKKTTEAPVDTCSFVDMCISPRICHSGTCKQKKCSNDFSCICLPGHTGQFCDKKVNGGPKGTTSSTETPTSSNGKHHVNGVVNPNLITGKTDDKTIVPTDSKSQPIGNVNNAKEPSNVSTAGATIDNTKTTDNDVANVTKNSKANSKDRNIPNGRLINTTVTPLESKRPLQTTMPDGSRPLQTTMPDGSYRKGPESTKHSDNSPVDAHITKQKVKTNAPSLIQPKSDVVTIPTTVVETSVSKVETPPEVKASIIKQTDITVKTSTKTADRLGTTPEVKANIIKQAAASATSSTKTADRLGTAPEVKANTIKPADASATSNTKTADMKGTPPAVKESIIKQKGASATASTNTADRLGTAVEEITTGNHDHSISMVQSSEFVEKPTKVSNINDLGISITKKEKIVGTVRIGNHDVPVLLEQPEIITNKNSNSQTSKTQEPSVGSPNSLPTTTKQNSSVDINKKQNLKSNKMTESTTSSILGKGETKSSKRASKSQSVETQQTLDTAALLQLLNILGSPDIAETVKAVKIEIITKSNTTARTSNEAAKNSQDVNQGAQLIVSTTQSPP